MMQLNNSEDLFSLKALIENLKNQMLNDASVIMWGAPVPVFGDYTTSKVATLGLNPSNREFVDIRGNELEGHARRFETLRSLNIKTWDDISSSQVNLISDSCKTYFKRSPYNGWFGALDNIISGTGRSYYDDVNHACHLDLIPYATTCKWTQLNSTQRTSLLKVSGDALGHILHFSPIQLLILNGKTVVKIFEDLSNIEFKENEVPEWTLERKNGANIRGIAYVGYVSKIANVHLGRDVLVLGYNHNIQSSFGVTNQVKAGINSWITKLSNEVLT